VLKFLLIYNHNDVTITQSLWA